MKRFLSALLSIFLLASCSPQKTSFDGRDRPSSRGHLQVLEGQLCGADGQPVMLRGISNHGVSLSHMYTNADTYNEISRFMGANVIRLALYTWGVGSAGYCTGGNQKALYDDVAAGIEYAKENDMYVLADWHVLEEGDPNRYIEDAKVFFDTLSKQFGDYDNLLYEICNEPNKTDWQAVKQYAEEIIPVIRHNDPDAVIIVGTTDWSKDVHLAADDPLEYDNLLYTFHFYSASHGQAYRDQLAYALDKGLPVMVTEFGICASSGGFPLDKEEADRWIEFLEERKVSWIMWNFSKTGEACASLQADCLKTKEYVREDFSETGQWLIDTIAAYPAQK